MDVKLEYKNLVVDFVEKHVLSILPSKRPFKIEDDIYAFKCGNECIITKRIENEDEVVYPSGFLDLRQFNLNLILYYNELFAILSGSDVLPHFARLIKMVLPEFPVVDFNHLIIDDKKYESKKQFEDELRNVISIVNGVVEL